MTNLVVKPKHLEDLAKKQDDASKKSAEAATAASNIEVAVWVTHGVISGVSNGAFAAAEGARRGASGNISTASSDLAAKLRAAKETYSGVDDDLRQNLDTQVHSE